MDTKMTARTTRIPHRSEASAAELTKLPWTFGPFPTTVMTEPGPFGLARVDGGAVEGGTVVVTGWPPTVTCREKDTPPIVPDPAPITGVRGRAPGPAIRRG